MPRTWGYIIIVAAMAVGAAALLLPVPEDVEVAPVEAPRPEPAARPAQPPATPRSRVRTPAPPPAAAAPKPAVRPVPMQDTTKTRQLVQPKPAG